MNQLEAVRRQYGVPAKRGGWVRYSGTYPCCDAEILGGDNGRLRVRFRGTKITVRLHPTWCVEYK